jgi:hypothetical protein
VQGRSHPLLPVAPGRHPRENAVKCWWNGWSAKVAPAGKKEKRKEKVPIMLSDLMRMPLTPLCHDEEKS